MNSLWKSTKSEFAKLMIKKKYIVLTVISALICFIMLGSNILIAKLSDGEVVIKTNLIMSMLRYITDILVPIVVFMAVTDLFSAEVQEDTMKAALMRPLTRFKVMTSKSLAALLLACSVMLIMFVICFIMQCVSGNGIGETPMALAAYAIDMIPVFALVAMAVLINTAAKGPTLSMLLCIVIYIFFKYLNIYVSPVGQMIFTAYSQWHKIWIGTLLPLAPLLAKSGILLGSVLILYTLSYIIFDRKDF